MITALISILTTGLFLLFVLVLLAALVSSLYHKIGDGEKNPETSQPASFFWALSAIRLPQ